MDTGISERLVRVTRTLLGGPADGGFFPPDTRLIDIGISSLKLVNLMLAVEVEFDIAIPQADITPENFHSLATIEALVSRLVPH